MSTCGPTDRIYDQQYSYTNIYNIKSLEHKIYIFKKCLYIRIDRCEMRLIKRQLVNIRTSN